MQHPNHTLQTATHEISARGSSGRRPRLCTTIVLGIWTIHAGNCSDHDCNSSWISKHRVAPSEQRQVVALLALELHLLDLHRDPVQEMRRHLKTRHPLARSCWLWRPLLLCASSRCRLWTLRLAFFCDQRSSWQAGGSSRTSPPRSVPHHMAP